MKHILIFFSCVLAALPVWAQEKDATNLRANQQLAIQYDDVSVGRNINITYHQGLRKGWYLYGGFKYHINSKYYRNDWEHYTPYYKGTYAESIDEHFGAKLGLEKMIWQPNPNIVFSAFYEIQYTKGVFNNRYLKWGRRANGTWELITGDIDLSSLQSFENNIGLVAHIKISNRLLFRLQAGIGLSYLRTGDSTIKADLSGGKLPLPLPLSRMFGFGFEYNLHNTAEAPNGNSKKRRKKEEMHLPSLSLGYDDLQTGRNFNIVYRTPLRNNTYIYGGLKLNMGSHFYSDYTLMGHNYYFKQFRPDNISQRFGIKAGLEHYVALPHSRAKLFGFYDFQVMRAAVKNLDTLYRFYSGSLRAWSPFIQERKENAHPVYRPYGPVTAFENYAGAGLLLPLAEGLNFRIQGGVGLNYYLGPKNDDWGREWKADRVELSRMFGLGLQYNLRKRN